MKAISLLTLSAALLVTGVGFAQTPAQHNSDGSPPPTATNSSSGNSDIQQSNSAAANTPSKATDANGGASIRCVGL